MNFPSASRLATCTRGWERSTVSDNDGLWAAAAPVRATAARASGRTAGPRRTLEAVLEAQREAQRLPHRHGFGDVHAESAPVHPKADVREPARKARDAAGGHPAGPAADQPRLPGLAEHDEVRALEADQRLAASRLLPAGVVAPVQGDVAAVLRLHGEHPVAGGDPRVEILRRDNRLVARHLAESITGEHFRPAEADATLHRQRVPSRPTARHQPQVQTAAWAHTAVATQVEPDAVEPVGAVGRNVVPHSDGDARLGSDVFAAAPFESGDHQPTGGRVGVIVAGVEDRGGGPGIEMTVVDRRIGPLHLIVARDRERVARRDQRHPLAAELQAHRQGVLGLEVGPRRPSLIEEVVAVVAVEQERRPADLFGVQPPVLDRRHDVGGAQTEPHRGNLAGPSPRAYFRAQPVAQVRALVGEVAGRAEHAERVEAQMGRAGDLPIEDWSEHDRQAFHAVERATRGERQGRAGFRGAERQLRLRVPEAPPQVRRVRQRLAGDAVGQGVAVLAHFAAHACAGGAAHRTADDEQVPGHLGSPGQRGVAVDDEHGALHAALDQYRAAAHRDVAAPLVAARQVREPRQARGAGRVVQPDRLLSHDAWQLRGHEVHSRALGVDDDGRVLRGERRGAGEAEEEEQGCTHGWGPRWRRQPVVQWSCRAPGAGPRRAARPGGEEACHPVTLRGGSSPSRRIRRYRLARSVARRRAASATLPWAAESARAMSVRSYWSSASASATSRHSAASPPAPGVAGRAPSCGSTRTTCSAVIVSSVDRITSRSTMLANSRTLPGQAWAASSWIAPASTCTGRPRRAACRAVKCLTSGGTSSGRSRNGGMCTGSTLRRKNRSSRKWFCCTARCNSLLVAAITRTSTWIGRSPPTRSITPLSSTRNSFACASAPRSPTSSRNSVPVSANSNRPSRRSAAPVKAPFSWPNISDSTRSLGIAALFTVTNGFAARRLCRWIADATSSFPVPDSPVISTRDSVGATRAIHVRSSSIAPLTPTSGSAWPSCSCRRRFCCSVRPSSSALRIATSTPSGVSGFSRN